MSMNDFLLARIAEDEQAIAVYATAGWHWETSGLDCDVIVGRQRALAECEAKRRIVSNHPSRNACWHDGHGDPCWDLRALASVYADHPDYRPEWCA